MKDTFKVKMKTPCSCGRKPRDMSDLASILEFHHKHYSPMGSRYQGVNEQCEVVCLRKGCMGRWRSKQKYTHKLPLIMLDEYNRVKKDNVDINKIRLVKGR